MKPAHYRSKTAFFTIFSPLLWYLPCQNYPEVESDCQRASALAGTKWSTLEAAVSLAVDCIALHCFVLYCIVLLLPSVQHFEFYFLATIII